MTATSPTIRDFMTPIPATVSDELTLADALDRMYSDNVRHLPVVDSSGVLVGIVSTRDIAVAASVRDLDPEKTSVAAAMTSAPYACDANTPLIDVAYHLEHERLGSAIVTEGGRPIGIFTTTDALRALRTYIAGHPVEPAVRPSHLAGQEAEPVVHKHPIKPSVRVSRYDGMISWFLARL
ncbi:MAG: CBS domain-containing protein [Nannocystaceae bacterium]